MSINRELSQLASFIDVQEDNNFIGISTGGTYTVGIGTSSVIIGSTGIITATQFHGPSGSSLIDKIDLQDEGSPVGTGFTTLNFVGTGVTITEGASGIATVSITGTAIIGTIGEVEVIDNGDGTTTLTLADELGITSSLTVGTVKIESGIITATSGIVTYHGDGSGLTNINASSLSGIATDSDKLDGEDGTYYLDYANFSGIATDSDKLDGQDGTYYLDYANFTNTPPDIRWFGTAVGIWTSSSVGIGTTNATSTLTVDGTLNVSGVSTFQNNVFLGNNDKLTFGDSGDELQIYHTGSLSYISDQGPGSLRLLSNQLRIRNHLDNAELAKFVAGGRVELYYNNSVKFETVGTGVSISSGTASTATIYGPGNLIIDPAPIDDNGGIVRIKGDLYVDGTTTEINSTTLTIDDLNVVVASGATNGLTADGAGLSVAGAGATIKYNYNGGSEQWVFNKAPYYNTDRLLTTADEGDGNGIDADTLDNEEGTYYLDYNNFVGVATDSDKLDGQQGTYYLDYANFSGIATDSDKLDGQQGTYYLNYSNFSGIATDSSLLSGISSTSFLRSDVADIKTSGNLKFNDGVQLRFGTDNDFQFYHSGTASMIVNTGTGNIRIRNSVDDADVVIQTDDSSGGSTDYFRADGSTGEAILYHYGSEKLNTRSAGIDVTGNAYFGDGDRVVLGAGNDFQLYHTGTQSTISNLGGVGDINIENSTDDGSVIIRTDNGSGGSTEYIDCDGSTGEVKLYHYGTQKFATKSNGIAVSGIVTASSGIVTYYGDGSGLTNVDAATLDTLDSTQFLRSDVADEKTDGRLKFSNNVNAEFGDNSGLTIYANPSNSYITNSNGTLYIGNSADDEDIIIQTDNGSGGTANYFLADGSTGESILYHYGSQKLATKSNGIDVTGHTETDTLNVSGIATAQDFNSASDENLKTNIRTIEDPLAKVVQIRGVNFDWKENQRPALGVIAQEIEKVLPELVTDNGTKTVNYNGLIGLLIEAVKAQQEEIDILKSKIK